MDILKIENLFVSAEEKEILKDLNLSIKKGSVQAIMGLNGSGKSTLAQVLAGNPAYHQTSGTIEFNIKNNFQNLLNLSPHERANLGLFVSFQHPVEVSGVSTVNFLKECLQNKLGENFDSGLFLQEIKAATKSLELDENFYKKDLNFNLSGGQKKKNEILQMLILKPKLAILDEIDSGLDVDALRVVAENIKSFVETGNTVLLITHYTRLLDLVRPEAIHVILDGKIAENGDLHLARRLEKEGYDFLKSKF